LEAAVNIKSISLPRTAALAPMAGVADRAFREVCAGQGACYRVGEMASAKGLVYGSSKTAELLETAPAERPMAIQLFGDEPEIMARAVELAMAYTPEIIDINMGCPAPKIAGSGAGAALMKNLPLAGEILRAAVAVSPVPVTVKIRAGWDADHLSAVEAARIAEEAGAAAITVHGRTRAQMYAPPVDLDIIRRVKEAVAIPVIGNGDVTDVESAVEMYEKTGCDLVMIGRGAVGRPWIFRQIQAFLLRGEKLPDPPLPERMESMLAHIRLACLYKGERIAMREARAHAAWYLKGIHGAAAFRRQASQLVTFDDLERLAGLVLETAD
jgi:nifR3 family TIM-barrel protein